MTKYQVKEEELQLRQMRRVWSDKVGDPIETLSFILVSDDFFKRLTGHEHGDFPPGSYTYEQIPLSVD